MIEVIQKPDTQTKRFQALTQISEAGALSRLFSAALVDQELCARLLVDPLSVVEAGYLGENFLLGERVVEAMISIRALDLAQFATELLKTMSHAEE
jgi:hypothetical protein